MSHRTPDVNKDGENEPKFLTLADKQPSVLLSGVFTPKSVSTVSTRQLSDNLQTTRDGLINLMKKQSDGNGKIRTTRGSDSETGDENDNFQNFGMPIRNKQSGKGGQSGGMTNNKDMLGKRGLAGSKEFDNADQNQNNGLSSQDGGLASKNLQRGKYGSDGDDDGIGGGGKNFDQGNDELFSSQNPKKDGPLYTRIFIDAFLPSLEGNRIFPLFNYRCAEKLERSNKDYYERKRKSSQKQLPVVGTEESWNVKDSQLPTDQREVVQVKDIKSLPKEEKLVKVEELGKVEQFQAEHKVEELHKSKEFQQVKEIEVLQKVENLQEVEELQDVEEVQVLQNVKELQKIEEIQELHNVEETQEIVEVPSVQEVEEQHEEIANTTGTNKVLDDKDESPQFVEKNIEIAEKEVKTSNVEMSEQAKDVLGNNSKADVPASPIHAEQPSEEEQKLMHKVLRAMLANEELIDIFCEKVISKIAARNDFCGPNCGSTCGGLNKPRTDKDK